LVPALLSGAALLLVGLTTLELGGKIKAVTMACLAVLVSGIHLSYSTFYSMNVIDLFLWSWAMYLTVRLVKYRVPVYWIGLGLLLGIASLNKIAALFFAAGVAVAVLATTERHWLKTRWPYLAGVITLVLFSPYVFWNLTHDMAHLEFIHNASTIKYSGVNPGVFWAGQMLINNPVTLPVWLLGFVYFFTHRDNLPFRFLFIIFLTVVLILTINWTSKPEYLAAIFPVLLMGGALQIEQWTDRYRILYPITVGLLLLGVALFPFALPLLPPSQYVAYANFTGIKPDGSEGHTLAELPQFYADMFGWENQAEKTALVYHSLPAAERERCAIFGDNYGRSGAIDYYAEKYRLPKSIGKHNNYWLWGPGDYDGSVLIILSHDVGNKAELFESVEDRGIVHSPFAIPHENNLHIYVCRGLKMSPEELWSKIKVYM
jgi:4-amino-4-deoxy-L-arabinose transferase-like glycosyltransferase